MLTILTQRAMKYSLKAGAKTANRLPWRRALYFAYGANMDPENLVKKGIHPRSSRVAKLDDHELRINVPCEWIGKGFASVSPAPGRVAYGVLHDVSAYELALIDVLEWVPFHFHRRVLGKVQTSDGISVSAQYYVASHPTEGLKTSGGYRDLLVGAALKFQFSESYVQHLRSLPVGNQFVLDHGFRLSNPEKRRPLESELRAVYQVHDRARERLCQLLP